MQVRSSFSTNRYRSVDLMGQLAHGVDHADAINRLQAALKAIRETFGAAVYAAPEQHFRLQQEQQKA